MFSNWSYSDDPNIKKNNCLVWIDSTCAIRETFERVYWNVPLNRLRKELLTSRWVLLKNIDLVYIFQFTNTSSQGKILKISFIHLKAIQHKQIFLWSLDWALSDLSVFIRLGSAPDVRFHLLNAYFYWNWFSLLLWRSERRICSAPSEFFFFWEKLI